MVILFYETSPAEEAGLECDSRVGPTVRIPPIISIFHAEENACVGPPMGFFGSHPLVSAAIIRRGRRYF
jgi:hypothetical protein